MTAIFIDDRGTGQDAVVLLHGTPMPPGHLSPLSEAPTSHFRVLVPHLPGYGRSPPWPAPYEPTGVLCALEHALSRLGVTRAALIGLSGGA